MFARQLWADASRSHYSLKLLQFNKLLILIYSGSRRPMEVKRNNPLDGHAFLPAHIRSIVVVRLVNLLIVAGGPGRTGSTDTVADGSRGE